MDLHNVHPHYNLMYILSMSTFYTHYIPINVHLANHFKRLELHGVSLTNWQ